MKRTVIAALFAAASLASAQSFAGTYFGDENDLSWLPHAATKQDAQQPAKATESQRSSIVHFGDENDLSWLPRAAQR